jgi:16S rRNA processing protein RimM
VRADSGLLFSVGRIVGAHGIRGELVFAPGEDMPEPFPPEIFLRPRQGGAVRSYRVARIRTHHKARILALEGVEDRNVAATLRSHTVLLPAENRAGNEPALASLAGIRVFVPDETGSEREIGRIVDAVRPAGQTIWSIGTKDGREILFPAVEAFILSLDTEKGEARIAPPPGLLELYL